MAPAIVSRYWKPNRVVVTTPSTTLSDIEVFAVAVVVQKFGGSSVKDADRVMEAARKAIRAKHAGNQVIVVVSAQGSTTDDLIAKAAEITGTPSAREMDMLLATGEQIS